MYISELEEELSTLKKILGDVEVRKVRDLLRTPMLDPITKIQVDKTKLGEKVVTIE